VNPIEQELDKERARRDAHYFIFEKLRTKDEHKREDPVSQFPNEVCLRATIDCYLVSGKILQPEEAVYALDAGLEIPFLKHIYETGIIFIEKSRHVMVTWITCGYLLWRARRDSHQLIMVQSKEEESAAKLVYEKEPGMGRMSFLEIGLPEHLIMCEQPKNAKYCHMYFPNGSEIWAIAEGGHKIRSHNPSVIFSDEACFQPEFGNAYAASLPAITHGGQLIVVSSAHPGTFQFLCESDLE
jgi:hypothetical protein